MFRREPARRISSVEESSPMKRGLKGGQTVTIGGSLPSVEESSPMKRGLKAITTDVLDQDLI